MTREELIEAIILEVTAPSDEFTRYDDYKARKKKGSTERAPRRNPYTYKKSPFVMGGPNSAPKRAPRHGHGGVMY